MIVTASNGITFIPNFVKIGQQVHKSKGDIIYTQHSCLIGLLISVKKEIKLKMSSALHVVRIRRWEVYKEFWSETPRGKVTSETLRILENWFVKNSDLI
jgi:hypothetical protein